MKKYDYNYFYDAITSCYGKNNRFNRKKEINSNKY